MGVFNVINEKGNADAIVAAVSRCLNTATDERVRARGVRTLALLKIATRNAGMVEAVFASLRDPALVVREAAFEVIVDIAINGNVDAKAAVFARFERADSDRVRTVVALWLHCIGAGFRDSHEDLVNVVLDERNTRSRTTMAAVSKPRRCTAMCTVPLGPQSFCSFGPLGRMS